MNNSEYKNPFHLEIIAWCLFISLLLLPMFYYDALPDEIPSHYNAVGKADAYSHKASIWIIPVIGSFVFFLLHFLAKNKNIPVNYPSYKNPIDEEYKQLIGRKLLNALKIIIPGAFLYITYRTILTALGQANGLGNYFIFVFLAAVFGTIGYFVVQMNKGMKN